MFREKTLIFVVSIVRQLSWWFWMHWWKQIHIFILHPRFINHLTFGRSWVNCKLLMLEIFIWHYETDTLIFQLDDSVLKTIECSSKHELEESRNLIRRIRRRDLYQVQPYSEVPDKFLTYSYLCDTLSER